MPQEGNSVGSIDTAYPGFPSLGREKHIGSAKAAASDVECDGGLRIPSTAVALWGCWSARSSMTIGPVAALLPASAATVGWGIVLLRGCHAACISRAALLLLVLPGNIGTSACQFAAVGCDVHLPQVAPTAQPALPLSTLPHKTSAVKGSQRQISPRLAVAVRRGSDAGPKAHRQEAGAPCHPAHCSTPSGAQRSGRGRPRTPPCDQNPFATLDRKITDLE